MSGSLLLIAVLQALTILAGLVRAKGLALLLGPAAFGIVSTVDQVVVAVVTLGAFAVPFTAMKFMARAGSDASAFARVGSGFLRLMLTLAIASTAVVLAMVAVRPDTFGRDLSAYATVLRIGLLGVPSAMLLMFFVNSFAAAKRPVSAAAFNFAAVGAGAVAAIAGAWWRGTAGVYYVGVTVAVAVTVTGVLVLARRLGIRLRGGDARVVASLRAEPEILGYSLCFYATFAAGSLMMLILRTIVLSRLGEVAAGQLQALFSIALTVGAVLYPLSNLYLAPLLNSQAPNAVKIRAADDLATRMLVLLLAGASAVVLFPTTLLRLLFAPGFTPAATVLWVFVLWQCVFQVAFVYHQLLIGLDDVLFAAAAMIAGSAAAAALGAPLSRAIGLGGAGVALAAGMAMWGLTVLARLRWRHGARVSTRVVTRLTSVVLIVGLVGYGFAGTPEHSAGQVALRAGVAAVILLVCFGFLDAKERDPRIWLAGLRPRSDASVA